VRTNRNRIEFDRDLVRRYPLNPADRADLRVNAACQEAARAAGLPVPAVVSVHADANPPHMVMVRAYGTPLMDMELSAHAGVRLAGDLVALLTGMHRIREWPRRTPAWSRVWQVLARIAPTPETERAAALAASVRTSLMHGDLSTGNLLVGDGGDLLAVIDWDGAAIGDPALDWAALCANVPRTVADALRARHPAARTLDRRAGVYLDTWPVQHELWLAGRHPWLSGDRALTVPRVAGT
jgi:aminoglycoside phosphotransferase (APT) family kinase protein